MGFLQFLKGIFSKKKKKIGLALGSGGAKGAALIGALKAFEEENIKFDFVAGSSIGAIVGGMYALGYTASEMLNIIKEYRLTDVKNIVAMSLKGETVESLLDKITGEKHFEDTLIPFRAVAVDILSGEEVIMSSGSLAKAMAASGAIPPVFKPVERLQKRLVDGAYLNAVPADVVKSLGADKVIAIALSSNEPTNRIIKKSLDLLYKDNKVPLTDRLHQSLVADYILYPELSDYTSASIGSIDKMYAEGYKIAKEAVPQILKIIN